MPIKKVDMLKQNNRTKSRDQLRKYMLKKEQVEQDTLVEKHLFLLEEV